MVTCLLPSADCLLDQWVMRLMQSTLTIRHAYLMGREHLTASGIAEAAIQAEVLLRHALAVDRAALYARWEGPMPVEAWQRYERVLSVRASGRPIHYILGGREFMGLSFAVDERVMIPRPETEALVTCLIEVFRDRAEMTLVDVGTGSGCIAVSLARFLAGATVYATDISRDALEVARANARRHGVEGRIVFLEGDLLAPLPASLARRIDAIASNPPYVPRGQASALPREIREHEPAIAIFAPDEGIEMHLRLIAESPAWLRPSGVLAMEVGIGQAERVAGAMHEGGCLGAVRVVKDLAAADRVVVGTLGQSEVRPGNGPEGRNGGGRN